MRIYRNKGKWWVDYTINGIRKRKPVSTRRDEAVQVLARIRSDMLQKKYAIHTDMKITLLEFSKKYLRDYSKPSKAPKSFESDVILMRNLIEFFGGMFIADITDLYWDQYRALRKTQKVRNRERMVSNTTINREGALLRGMLNKAVQWGFLTHNPIKKMKMFKEVPRDRILSKKELKSLIDNSSGFLRSIIVVAMNTGMRIGEILTLHWDQVILEDSNLEDSFISIIGPKEKVPRRIFMNKNLRELFVELLKNRGSDKWVFENPLTGRHLTTIRTAWTNLKKRCEIEDFRFHDLRHCFATYALDHGDIYSLSKILGHARITTTERYLSLRRKSQKKLVAGFDEDKDNI
jgi:integrase